MVGVCGINVREICRLVCMPTWIILWENGELPWSQGKNNSLFVTLLQFQIYVYIYVCIYLLWVRFQGVKLFVCLGGAIFSD